MKKIKRITATLLSAGILAGAAALTACNVKSSSQPAKTTVENAEEWKSAFDIFSLDNFSYTAELYDGYEGSGERVARCVVDLTNLKYCAVNNIEYPQSPENPAHSETVTAYFESDNNSIWIWDSYEGRAEKMAVEQNSSVKDTFIYQVRESLALSLFLSYKYSETANSTEGKTLSEFYSAFTYQDGYYITQSLYQCEDDKAFPLKITLADGLVRKMECTGEVDGQQFRYAFEFYDLNKSTVQTPSAARTAIDAAKANG